MSNTKFTKGPWTLSSHRTIYDTNGTHICDASIGKSGVPYGQIREEEIANAKLIAAAPELLEALQKLKDWVGKLEDWKGEDPPCELIDSAIKKATE